MSADTTDGVVAAIYLEHALTMLREAWSALPLDHGGVDELVTLVERTEALRCQLRGGGVAGSPVTGESLQTQLTGMADRILDTAAAFDAPPLAVQVGLDGLHRWLIQQRRRHTTQPQPPAGAVQ
jgi:hypothetical protein